MMNQVQPIQAIWLAMVLVIGGCGSLDRAPKTVYESLYISAAAASSFAQTANDLRARNVIDRGQHQRVLDVIEDALDAAEDGLAAYEAGRFSDAQSGLDIAEASLRAASVLLTRFQDG